MLSSRIEELLLMRRVQIAFLNASLSFVLSIALTNLPIYAADRCEAPGVRPGESLLTGIGPVAITMGDFNQQGRGLTPIERIGT